MARDTDTDNAREERATIGTPAGESPEEGRKRHGTECLTDACEMTGPVRRRKIIEAGDIEAGETDEEEMNSNGGLTGTRVKGGMPPGGTIENDTV